MMQSEKKHGGYIIPNWIVHSVVPGLILAILSSTGAAVWASYSLIDALDKVQSLPEPIILQMTMQRVDALPSEDLAEERRKAALNRDQRQDSRIKSLERAVFWRESTGDIEYGYHYACVDPELYFKEKKTFLYAALRAALYGKRRKTL